MNFPPHHHMTEKEKKAFHWVLLLIVGVDLVILGHATYADWSFLVLAISLELNI